MVTTRKAAHAVRLNRDWEAKYRQQAEQLLLSTDRNHQAEDCKLQSEASHPPDQQQQQQRAGDCNRRATTVAAGDEEVRLQQIAISGDDDGEQLLLDKESDSDYHELNILHQQNEEALSGSGEPYSLCVVGRAGAGKTSLINHLLQKRVTKVIPYKGDYEEQTFEYQGLFSIRAIPGYDGWHSINSPSLPERLFQQRQGSSHSSHGSHHSTHGRHNSGSSSHIRHSSSGDESDSRKQKKLTLDKFVQVYGLFGDKAKAIIFVVNNRITPDDQRLMELAVESRKFFCIVCTNADSLVQIADDALQMCKLEELEEHVRRDLSLIKTLNVRLFFLSIPFPEGQATGETLEGQDLQCVMQNTQNLHFPLLKSSLSEPRGLLDEIKIHGIVKAEVLKVRLFFQTVKKRDQALNFVQHLVAGTLLPFVGPVMVSFTKTLCYTLKLCAEFGLIEDAEGAMEKVTADVKRHGSSAKVASTEALVTAVHDSMIHIFGEVVFEIALADVVLGLAETAFSAGLPIIGPMISTTTLPSRYKKIAEKLAAKACMLHELWVMQNVTGLLGRTN